MPITAKTRFVFHNVGQGLLYTGHIKFYNNNDQQFNFVYDCGSIKKSKIDFEISRFRKNFNTNERKIDLLILSHFHNDHINGLDKLLDSFTVKRVIIPYFSPIERLIISLKNPNFSTWYYVFLSNPFQFLIDKGVEEIIIINASKGFDENNNNLPESPIEKEKIKMFINLKKEENKVIEKFFGTEKIYENKKNKIIIYRHDGYITISNLWLFKFFNYKISENNRNDFEECLKQIDSNIFNIISKKTLRDKAKNCYKELIKDNKLRGFNNTSLVMMHTPINPHKVNKIKFLGYNNNFYFPFCPPVYNRECFEDFIYCLRHCYHNKKWGKYLDVFIKKYYHHNFLSFAHSLTGDLDLNFNYRVFSRHFDFFKDKLLINQLPHHGCKKNFNNSLLNDFIPLFNIACAGINNSNGHPSKMVFEKIMEHGLIPIHVDENKWFTSKSEILWE